MKLDRGNNNQWTESGIRQLFRKSADLNIDKYELGNSANMQTVLFLYCEGIAETKQINHFVLPQLEYMMVESDPAIGINLDKKLDLTRIDEAQDIVDRVFSGHLVLYFVNENVVYALDIANPPQREPEESNTEIAIKGPRDGFTEELVTNVALVRKRLRSNSLCYEQFTIGKRSRSKVGLLYIEDIARPETIEEARARLRHIELDAMFSSSQLEEILSDSSLSLFPLLHYSNRPDFVVDCLLRGRFAVIIDGGPTAVIAPAGLTLLLRSAEDVYMPYYLATFNLFHRLVGLFVSLFLPGFWIALGSYNIEQLPYPMVATIALSRIGLPFPAPLEAFIMVGMFEIFREAGERLPKAVGSTVAVVGGIVVGEAAIRAGLASTTLVVVAAITAVANFTLVNQSLVGSVSIIRLLVMMGSSVLGMYGFILSTIAVVLYLSTLKSFGVPYLAPLSPITWRDVVAALVRKPWYRKNRRPEILQTIDKTRKEKDS